MHVSTLPGSPVTTEGYLQTLNSNSCEDAGWWALYTRHQHEKVVADVLTLKGFEVFLPEYTSVRRWKDRRTRLTLPLFPCYVFVRGRIDRRLQIISTPGIHMVLSHGDQIVTIPDSEICNIRSVVESYLDVEPHPFLRCGERVRVTHGPLTGVEGILIRKKNLYRLVLSVSMLAQSVAVEIDAVNVAPVLPHTSTLTPLTAALPDRHPHTHCNL